MLNVLGIIYNPKNKKILIGKREEDLFVKGLSWCFPGGRPKYGETLEQGLKREVTIKTGLDIDIKKLIFARVVTEKKDFLLIYYFCECSSGKARAGEKFSEVKWIKPSEVKKYFTTSVDPAILKFLKSLK